MTHDSQTKTTVTRHTGEPWSIRPRQPWWDGHPYYNEMQCAIIADEPRVDAVEWEVCVIGGGEESSPPDDLDIAVREFSAANATRIVQCVNACASIQGDPGEGIRKAIEALESADDILGRVGHADGICGTTTRLANGQSFREGCQCGLDGTREDIQAALSALKGGED